MSNPFAQVTHAASLMSGFAHTWLIAGGWAIDLYLGRVTRAHKDVDVMVFRPDQMSLQHHFAGWHLYIADAGQLHPWHRGEYLQLPMHGIWAYPPDSRPPHTPDIHPDLDILLDDLCPSGDEWRFRRDPAITRPLDKVILRTKEGIPYVAPEIGLLYKSKYHRAEDDSDFNQVCAALSEERRAWLVGALEICQPEHAWLGKLRRL